MHTLIKHKIAPIFATTALALATVGGSAAGSAPMFDGGRSHSSGFGGFHRGFGGFRRGGFHAGFGPEVGGRFGHGFGDRFGRFERFGRSGASETALLSALASSTASAGPRGMSTNTGAIHTGSPKIP